MLTLDQVHALESRVEKAVSLIASLNTENTALREGLFKAEGRVVELEELVREFQVDQTRIEEGIVHALERLSGFEDIVRAEPKPAPGKATPLTTAPVTAKPESIPAGDEETVPGAELDIF